MCTPLNSFEIRIEKAHRTLQLHSALNYPLPPPIPHAVAQAKLANKGKSYARYLKLFVSKEWLRLVRVQHANSPNPPTGTPTSRSHAHFLLHHLSLTTNLYKPSPDLCMCREKNPMTLLRLRDQSHQQVPTHMLTIEHQVRDKYADRTCPHCSHQNIGSEIHLILQCPATKHIANEIIRSLTNTLKNTGQPAWSSLNPHQQTSLILGDPPTSLPKKFQHTWLQTMLPSILTYIALLEKHLYHIQPSTQQSPQTAP